VRIYRCPADPTTTGNASFGPGNYVTNNLLFKDRVRYEAKSLPDGTTQPSSFPKGTAYTILFAEKYAECSFWAVTSGPQVPWYGAHETSGFQVLPERCDPTLPQTPHHSGMQVVMADGSARHVSPSIDPGMWYAANNPVLGNKLTED
jgi:hypothetical protein